MRGKLLTASILACLLGIGLFVVSQYNNNTAMAKSQTKQPTPAERMAIYSVPHQKSSTTPVRQSRLKEQNIVSEAANVLNILPIDIINEMKKGKTLAQVAKDKGLSETEFNKKLTDYDKKLTDTAVKDGEITKKHGDAINAGRTDRIKSGMNQKAMKVTDQQGMDMGNN